MGLYHAFIGIIEGGATAFALSLIIHARPDIVGGDRPEKGHKAKDIVIAAGIAIALSIAILAPYYASTYPDALDSTFLTLSGVKNTDTVSVNESGVASVHTALLEKSGNSVSWQAPFSDYTIPGMDKPGEVLAIIFGVVVLFALGFGISRFIARKE
jgi:cobalt/nickel transport protein